LREAQKQQAIAVYDEDAATYRQTVLTAFQEVEDNLAALRILNEEARLQDEVVQAHVMRWSSPPTSTRPAS